MIGYQVLWVEDEETPSDDVDVFKNIRNLIQISMGVTITT